jgi:hypothetical protein
MLGACLEVQNFSSRCARIFFGVPKGKKVRGRGGPYDCETSRRTHLLDNWLTDGGEVSLTRRPAFTPRKIPGTHFC